jgi:hypothetical protein
LGDASTCVLDLRALSPWKQPDEHEHQRGAVDQQIKRQDQDRDEAEDSADDSQYGIRDKPSVSCARARRRLLDRLTGTDLPRQQASVDQPLLRGVQQPRQLHREFPRLRDDRGYHHRADRHDDRDDAQINDENGGPPRHALPKQPLSFERVDERGEPIAMSALI